MIRKGLTPLQASEVNGDYQFLAAHITETHDLWHVVTGCDTNILVGLRQKNKEKKASNPSGALNLLQEAKNR
jgi:ubiquinone biosynthesis protein Coq4